MQAIAKKYDIQISQKDLENHISNVLTDLMQSGELEEVQRSLGERKFTQAISVLAAEQALDAAIRLQLRRIAAPESLPAEESDEQTKSSEVATEENQAEEQSEPAVEEEEKKEPESEA